MDICFLFPSRHFTSTFPAQPGAIPYNSIPRTFPSIKCLVKFRETSVSDGYSIRNCFDLDKNRKRKDWFRTAVDYLIPAINIRNKSYQKWSSDLTEPNREIYKTKRNELNRLKRQAIGRWMKKIASECDESITH
eukprot:scaffold56669_cov57-Attheya_sp.AAC.3